MSEKKVISFEIDITGVSNEANELAKIELQLKNIKKEKQELERLAKRGFASGEQIRQLAAYNAEIKKQETNLKQLKNVVDTADGSLARMRQELIRLKNQYAAVGAEARTALVPQITKLTNEVSKAEQAIGVHSRGVGNYKGGIIDAARELFGFAGIVTMATGAISKLTGAFKETETGTRVVKRWTEAVKTFFQSIVTGNLSMAGTNALVAAEIAKKWDDLRKGDREDLIEIARLEGELNKLRFQGADVTKSISEQLKFQELASAKEEELRNYKLADLQEELDLVRLTLTVRGEDTVMLDRQAQIQAELLQIENDRSLRIESKKSGLKEKQLKEQEAANKAVLDGQAKLQEEVDQYNKDKTDKEVKAAEERQKALDAFMKITDKQNIENFENKQERESQQFDQEQARLKAQNKIIEDINEEHEKAKFRIATSFTNIIAGLAGKNKAILKASLIADKAVAVAEIIIQTRKANAAILAWGSLAGPVGMALATAARIKNNISAAFDVGAVVAATVTGLAGFAKGGKIKGGLPVNTGTKDNRLIAVNETETVLTDRHVAMLGGSATMRKIKVPGYASGGFIGTQAPEIPSAGFDYQQLARLMSSMNIVLDIHKVNSAQREVSIITETQKI